MAFPATDLAVAGARVSPETLFRALSRTMLRRLGEWDRGRGFAAIRTAWLARAMGLGQTIRVSLPERELRGRFESLDDAGRLLLRREDATDRTGRDPAGPSLGSLRLPAGDPRCDEAAELEQRPAPGQQPLDVTRLLVHVGTVAPVAVKVL